MRIKIDERHSVGEENSRKIVVEFLEGEILDGRKVHIEFEKPSGAKYLTEYLESEIKGGVLEYVLPYSLLDEKGVLKFQVVVFGNGFTKKSDINALYICESIEASEELVKKNGLLGVIGVLKIDGDGTQALFDDGTYKPIKSLEFKVVDELPSENISTSIIYLKKNEELKESNFYEEYVFVDGKWELIGTTQVDLSNYATKDELFSGDYNDLKNKPKIPTKNSELENDSDFVTKSVNDLVNYYAKNETYTKDEVKAIIDAISSLSLTIVSELPTENILTTTIYLLPRETSENKNIYEEYIYINNNWELIGSTEIDLSNYVDLSSNQDISGVKNFTNGISISGIKIAKDSSDRVVFYFSNTPKVKIGQLDTLFANRLTPDASNTYDIGRNGVYWRDLYLYGKIVSNGNEIPVDDIAQKSKLKTIDGQEIVGEGNIATKDISVNEIKQMFAIGQGEDGLSTNYEFTKATNVSKGRQRACAYGNGYFVMVGASGQIEYSTDNGKTWTKITPFATGTLTGLAYGNGRFVLVEYESKKIWTTDVPTNEWKNVYTFENNLLEGCRYINNEFVVVGTYGLIAKSIDGTSWKVVHTYDTDIQFYDVTYGNGKYIACGQNGLTLYSYNGTTWYENYVQGLTQTMRHIAYANGTFVVGSASGLIYWSYDGLNWEQSNNPSYLSLAWTRGFAYGDNRLYSAHYASNGQGEIWLSEDKGKTWKVALTLTGTSRLWTICYGNNSFIAGGENGIIYDLNLGVEWLEERPVNTKVVYSKMLVIQNDGSKTESDVYKQVSVDEIKTYSTTAPQTEWFRIAKVKDIEKSSSGTFAFNIYAINNLTGKREVLSADIFSASCSIKNDEFISDVLSLTHSQTNNAGASGGSGNQDVGNGLTSIRFERYKDEIYVCGLFAIAFLETSPNIKIEMLIENNINFEYIDNFEIVYFENEYQTEYPLLEGTTLKADTNYAIKMQTTYSEFITNVKNRTTFSMEILDSVGDLGHLSIFKLAYVSSDYIWKLVTCSPKVELDEQGNKKEVILSNNGAVLEYFFDPMEINETILDTEALQKLNYEGNSVYGDLVYAFTSCGAGMTTNNYKDLANWRDNEYCKTRVKKFVFVLEYVGDQNDTEYKAEVIKNGEILGELKANSSQVIVELTSENDIVNIISEQGVRANTIKITLDLTQSIVEIEVPYKEKIDLYATMITTTNNNLYNFDFSYQEYFPHELSKSYLMASVYRNLIDKTNYLTEIANYLYQAVLDLEFEKVDYNIRTIVLSTLPIETQIKECIREIYNENCRTRNEIIKVYIQQFRCPVYSKYINSFVVTIERLFYSSSKYYFNTKITIQDIGTGNIYQVYFENKYYNSMISDNNFTYEWVNQSQESEKRPLKVLINENTYNQELEPNKYYIFDSQVSQIMTLTFAPESEEYLDEYMGEIRVDESAINVTFPNSIRWNENDNVTNNDGVLTLEAKNTYLFSIANSLGLITNIPNPSLEKTVVTINGSVLTWTPVENATSYVVQRSNGGQIGTEIIGVTTYDLATSWNAVTGAHPVVVVAKSNYYVDSKSEPVIYYKTEKLSTPTNLVLSDTGTLSWDTVENAESYEVYEAEGGTLLTTITVNYIDLTTITTLTGTYTIKVKAINTTSPNVYLSSELSEGISYTWEAST